MDGLNGPFLAKVCRHDEDNLLTFVHELFTGPKHLETLRFFLGSGGSVSDFGRVPKSLPHRDSLTPRRTRRAEDAIEFVILLSAVLTSVSNRTSTSACPPLATPVVLPAGS